KRKLPMSSSDARPSLYRAQTGATSRTSDGGRSVGQCPAAARTRRRALGALARGHRTPSRPVIGCRPCRAGRGPLDLDQLLLGGPAVVAVSSAVAEIGRQRRAGGAIQRRAGGAILARPGHPPDYMDSSTAGPRGEDIPSRFHHSSISSSPSHFTRRPSRTARGGLPTWPAAWTTPRAGRQPPPAAGAGGASTLNHKHRGTEKCKAGDRTGDRTGASARMADDGRAKRLKSSQDGGVAEVTELRARVAELESENAKLRLENLQQAGGIAALESENEQLRRRGQAEGNQEVLPVTVTVDLSRVTTGIVTHISSFLGTARELLNLALTCKSFGWRQPVSTLNWSLVEDVARQTVCSRATDNEMGCLPLYNRGTATWLKILHRHENLLMFDVLLGGYIEHRNGDKTAVCAKGGDYRDSVAVSGTYIMRSGVHYVEFLITGQPYIGIARPMPGLDADAYQEGDFCFIGDDHSFFPDFLAQRSEDWDDNDVHACDFSCCDGTMSWFNWDDELNGFVDWDGMESCQSGDTVGMLLNLDEGSLTIYKNNRRLGVMKDGLSGPYCCARRSVARATWSSASDPARTRPEPPVPASFLPRPTRYLARYKSICENVCGAVVGPGRGPMGGREAGRGADDVGEVGLRSVLERGQGLAGSLAKKEVAEDWAEVAVGTDGDGEE
ncbi:hypothetical protein THAOC_07426, partial [Thalassiosira oceanica]